MFKLNYRLATAIAVLCAFTLGGQRLIGADATASTNAPLTLHRQTAGGQAFGSPDNFPDNFGLPNVGK